MKSLLAGKRQKINPGNISREMLQSCADSVAKIIVSDPETYGCLMVIYERFEHEISLLDNQTSKIDQLRMRVHQLNKDV